MEVNQLIKDFYREFLKHGRKKHEITMTLTRSGYRAMDPINARLVNRGIARKMSVEEYLNVLRSVRN